MNESQDPPEKKAPPLRKGASQKPDEISDFNQPGLINKPAKSKLQKHLERAERKEREASTPDIDKTAQFVDFSWPEILSAFGEGTEAAPRFSEGVEMLRRIVNRGPDLEKTKAPVRSVALSFISICRLLRMDFMEGKTLAEIADQMNVSPEGVRKCEAYWSAELGVVMPFAKSEAGRARYSAAQLRRYARERAEKEAA